MGQEKGDPSTLAGEFPSELGSDGGGGGTATSEFNTWLPLTGIEGSLPAGGSSTIISQDTAIGDPASGTDNYESVPTTYATQVAAPSAAVGEILGQILFYRAGAGTPYFTASISSGVGAAAVSPLTSVNTGDRIEMTLQNTTGSGFTDVTGTVSLGFNTDDAQVQ